METFTPTWCITSISSPVDGYTSSLRPAACIEALPLSERRWPMTEGISYIILIIVFIGHDLLTWAENRSRARIILCRLQNEFVSQHYGCLCSNRRHVLPILRASLTCLDMNCRKRRSWYLACATQCEHTACVMSIQANRCGCGQSIPLSCSPLQSCCRHVCVRDVPPVAHVPQRMHVVIEAILDIGSGPFNLSRCRSDCYHPAVSMAWSTLTRSAGRT